MNLPNIRILLMVSFLLVGCSEPVFHGLSETTANELIVTLDRHGIDAKKMRDKGRDDAWLVAVPSSERVRAWQIMQQHGLPRQDIGGFESFYPTGGLIPTQSEERILLQYATAQELQKSLLKLPGVVDAHVHLVLPQKPRVELMHQPREKPRASVFLKYRVSEAIPAIVERDIIGLVSGAVEGLSPEHVSVLMSEQRDAEMQLSATTMLEHVGPIAVSTQSRGLLRGIFTFMSLTIVFLAAAVVFLTQRRHGQRQ